MTVDYYCYECPLALLYRQVGDQDVTVLFVRQPPLSWPSSRYGYLIAADYGTMGLMLLFLLPLLSDVLQWSDMSIVVVALLFKLVRTLWAGFCTETWMVFASVVSGALGGLVNSGLRSVLSKAGSNGEVGLCLFVCLSVSVSNHAHCLNPLSLSQTTPTVSVHSPCLKPRTLSQSTFPVSNHAHCLSPLSLSQTTHTISVHSPCLKPRPLSQSTLPVSNHA